MKKLLIHNNDDETPGSNRTFRPKNSATRSLSIIEQTQERYLTGRILISIAIVYEH